MDFISFSRGSLLPRDQTCVSYVSCIALSQQVSPQNVLVVKTDFETIHFCGLYLEFVTVLFHMSLSFKSEPQKGKNSVNLFLAIKGGSCIVNHTT